MKVLINAINYFPELTGIGKYTGEMAEWLVQQGHDVYVVTAPPYYPAWKVGDGYSGIKYRFEIINGVKIIRCPVWVPASPTGLTRLLHLISFSMSCLPVMLWLGLVNRPDVVQVIEPPISCAPGAWLTSLLGGSFSWLHVQDFEVDAAFDLGLLPSGPLRKVIGNCEQFIMRRFNRVSTISKRMVERLDQKGIEHSKQFLFENWTDINSIYPLEGENALRKELNIPDAASVLLYSGNMGKKQGLEILSGLAEAVKDRSDIVMVLCGDGVMRKELEAETSGCANTIFLPLQPVDRLNELLNLADIHLLPQSEGVEDLVMPSKLTNMLSSGRPVIATARGGTQVANVVRFCGKVVPPNDLEKLIEAVLVLIANLDERKRLGKSGRYFAENNWEMNAVLANAFSIMSP